MKAADGAGSSVKTGIEELHESGNDYGRRPGIRQERQLLQMLRGILRLGKVGMVFQNQGFILYIIPNDLGVLVENGQ